MPALRRHIDSLLQYINTKRNRVVHGVQMRAPDMRNRQARRPTGPGPTGTVVTTISTQEGRVEATIDAALTLVKQGIWNFSVDQVLEQLNQVGRNLGVAQPTSVIGTVLNGDARFTRTAAGKYQYVGPK